MSPVSDSRAEPKRGGKAQLLKEQGGTTFSPCLVGEPGPVNLSEARKAPVRETFPLPKYWYTLKKQAVESLSSPSVSILSACSKVPSS